MPIKASVHIGERDVAAGLGRDYDLVFSKSVNNQHLVSGKGLYASSQPLDWLRSIAYLPQEDRFLFAVAPETGIERFEDIAERRPALKIIGRSAEPVLKAYGFTYRDIEGWGGSVRSMEHTAQDARQRYGRGELQAFFGDGSAYNFSAWRWVAERGYRFLDIRPDVMEELERNFGLRRNVTPVGFLPGIDHQLIALDDSHIVLDCHRDLPDEIAYNVARAIDLNKRDIETCSIQVGYGEAARLPLIEPTYWSSLTGPIERQWDPEILSAPLHPGAERYYKEQGYI
jgi:TRAP-type uncharacterized transport system substrate-binding protein